MGKRKYEEVKEGYWVYTIQVPSINKYYVGVSKTKCHKRWIKFNYKGKSLEPYLNEWDSMIKTVLIDGLTKDEAYKYEGNIIRALSMNDLCINKQRSGLITKDKKEYDKQYREDNTEYYEQWRLDNPDYMKQWQKDNREKRNEYNKQRYQNDAEYREKILERQRQRRLKKKQQHTSVP